MFRRFGTFTGGIDLPEEKQATLSAPIRRCPVPERLRVPLAPCGGEAASAIVAPGDRVEAGQRIAETADGEMPIFAPLSGRVGRRVWVHVAGDDGPLPSPAIELTDLSAPEPLHLPDPTLDWRAAPEALTGRLAEGGLVTHRPGAVSLSGWVRLARRKGCRTLIANVMEHEPYVTADHRLLAEHGAGVVRGLAILARVLGIDDVIIAVDQRRTDAYQALVETTKSHDITRVALTHKYPTGNDTMLVKVLCRREVPIGRGPMDAGAAVTDAATCLAVYRWIACALPPIARAVTVAGERVEEPANFWVPFGMDCRELIAPAGPPVIHGGPMVAQRCGPDMVVSAGTDAVLALDAGPRRVSTPCIRCGWCTDHCPARLNIAALNDAFELSEIDRAARLGALACVECGVCSYVCPARLPLTQRVRRFKQAIRAGRRAHRFPGAGAGAQA